MQSPDKKKLVQIKQKITDIEPQEESKEQLPQHIQERRDKIKAKQILKEQAKEDDKQQQKQLKLKQAGLGALTKEEQPFFNKMQTLFQKVGIPKPGDWLHSHKEYGQSYEKYTKNNQPLVKDPKIIYLQPLQLNISDILICRLENVISGFYCGFQVKILKPIDLEHEKKITRRNQTKNPDYIQYNASDILEFLIQIRPRDSFCTVGFLTSDIYPRDEWNFVFGMANPMIGAGVFSFARYHDSFYQGIKFPSYEKVDDFSQVTYRSCRVLVHEIAHLFDLRHCCYYKCLMNGINSLEELEQKPFELCPGCLRKLAYRLNVQPTVWYLSFQQALAGVQDIRFAQQADLIDKQIKQLM